MIGSFLGPYLWGIARDLTGGYRVGLLWLVAAHLIGAAILFVARRVARSPAALQAVAVTTA
jgi:ACS family tartrate transporter-like MFS transporter